MTGVQAAAMPPWWHARRPGALTSVVLSGGGLAVPAYVAAGREDGPVLAVFGAVHGDEYEGPLAIADLLAALPVETLSGTLITVPVVNDPAYAAGSRINPADGENLARVFPGRPDGTPSERLAHLIATQCIVPADALIDLHSGGVALNGALLIGYTATGDDAGARSRALALAFGAPVVWEHPPPMPAGRTGSYALARGIPFIYTEGPGGGGANPDAVRCFTEGLRRCMIALGMLPGPQPLPRHRQFWRGGGDTDGMIAARVRGLFRSDRAPGAMVTAGTVIGAIVDYRGTVQERIIAPRAGVIPFIRRLPRVEMGDALYMLTSLVEEP